MSTAEMSLMTATLVKTILRRVLSRMMTGQMSLLSMTIAKKIRLLVQVGIVKQTQSTKMTRTRTT
eukprot:1194311-Ditylum_brightwellii.AAC.1